MQRSDIRSDEVDTDVLRIVRSRRLVAVDVGGTEGDARVEARRHHGEESVVGRHLIVVALLPAEDACVEVERGVLIGNNNDDGVNLREHGRNATREASTLCDRY